jgi:hypothetical protein
MKNVLIAAALLLAACGSSQPAPAVRGGGTPPAQPAGTPAFLASDEFDAASAVSVAEAEKAAVEEHVTEHADTVFVCPMHPDVASESPGKCPKCGMQLVPRRKP